MITILLTILHIVFCLVLVFVILVQGGRGQGMTGNAFGSGNVQSLFGTRAADFLTKATSISAICFIFTCLGLNMLEARKSRSLLDASRPATPVDVDAIKKALENVKQGKVVEPTAAATLPAVGDVVTGTKTGQTIPVPGKPAVPDAGTVGSAATTAAGDTVKQTTQSTPFNTAAASGDASKATS